MLTNAGWDGAAPCSRSRRAQQTDGRLAYRMFAAQHARWFAARDAGSHRHRVDQRDAAEMRAL